MYEGFVLDLVEEFVMNFLVNITRVRGEVIEVTLVISELSKILGEGKPVNKGHVSFEELVDAFHEELERKP